MPAPYEESWFLEVAEFLGFLAVRADVASALITGLVNSAKARIDGR